MLGRVDVTKFFNGAQTLSNFYVKPQGGAYRRMGSQYVGTTKSSGEARLIPFEFNVEQSYVLEFGNMYVRLWRNDGGTLEQLVTSGAAIIEMTTPYPTATLDKISFAQSADVLYLAHPDYAPRKLARASITQGWNDDAGSAASRTDEDGNVWSFGEMDFLNGPYDEYNSLRGWQLTASSITDQPIFRINDGASGAATFFDQSADATGTKCLEYRDNVTGEWRLGQIVAALNADLTAATGGTGDQGPCVTVNALPVYQVPDKSVIIYVSATANILNSNYSGAFKSSDVGKYIRITGSTEGNGTWHKILSIGTATADVADKVTVTSGTPFAMKSYSYPTDYLRFIQSAQLALITEAGTPTGSTAVLVSANTGRWCRLNLSGKILSGKFTNAAAGGLDCNSGNMIDFEFPYDDNNAANLQDGGSTRFWSLGAWGGSNGWPALVAFHEERLVFARTTGNPQGIWFSVAGDYENFSPTEYDSTVLDDNAISITIAGGRANYITWLQSGSSLLVGTIGAVWDVRASGALNEPLTPSNIKATIQSGYGAVTNDWAARVGDSVFYIQRSGRKLRETRYSYDTDSFIASDASVISEHIFRQGTGANRIVFSPDPNSTIWALLNDGTLAAMTYDKEQEVYAWHRHSLGGSGDIESIACIPDDSSEEWQLWMIVKRTINGSTVRYVEVLGNEFNPSSSTDKSEMKYIDSWISKSAASLSVTGLSHLEGATVHAVVDGAYDGSKTVSGGAITITRTGTTCLVGLPYTSTIKTVPYEGGNPLGTSQGRAKSVAALSIRVLNSIGLKFGQSSNSLQLVSFRNTTDVMDSSPALFTGDKELYKGGSYDGDGSFYIVQDQPYPLNILAIMPELRTHG